MGPVAKVEVESAVGKPGRDEVEVRDPGVAGEPGQALPALSDIERMAVTRRPVVIYRPRSVAGRLFEKLWGEVREAAEGRRS